MRLQNQSGKDSEEHRTEDQVMQSFQNEIKRKDAKIENLEEQIAQLQRKTTYEPKQHRDDFDNDSSKSYDPDLIDVDDDGYKAMYKELLTDYQKLVARFDEERESWAKDHDESLKLKSENESLTAKNEQLEKWKLETDVQKNN